jgi:hypothetical protein
MQYITDYPSFLAFFGPRRAKTLDASFGARRLKRETQAA